MALWPAGVVTRTLTVPTAPAGAVTEMWWSSVTLSVSGSASLAPKATAVAPVKFDPKIVTAVPPAGGPCDGWTPNTVGGGTS